MIKTRLSLISKPSFASPVRIYFPIFAARLLLLIAAVILFANYHICAATLPAGFTETQIGGLSSPTAMDFAPDGRLFVCQQGGQLRIIKSGALLPTPFLSVTTDSSGERGLLGITFDPNFSSNGFVYIYYTVTAAPVHNRVSRFTANGDIAVPGSEVVVLELDSLTNATNHNGGAIHFGPDGKLYIAVGENATPSNSQTLNSLLGKVLRISDDGSIPSDNPFFDTASGKNRAIWALGLRNPFTFTFLPGSTRMFINDVGQNSWEEINDGIAGSNYGWPTTEGPTTNPLFRAPFFAYGHGTGPTTGCAITGGTFYNPQTLQFPNAFAGKYFFADLCSGWIRVLDPATNTATAFASDISQPVDLKVAADGSLYCLAIGSGSVFRIQFPANQIPPTIGSHPASQSVTEGQSAAFSVTVEGSPTFSYQWQRNDANISGANTSTFAINTTSLADNGAKFRCVVTNAFGSVTSNEATLTITATPPPLTIITEPNSDHAIVLDSVNMQSEPFSIVNLQNFSTDQHTRVMLFATNLELAAGESSSSVTAQCEDQFNVVRAVTVEFIGKVPNFNEFTEVVARLPDGLPANGDVLISIGLHQVTSNKARIRIR